MSTPPTMSDSSESFSNIQQEQIHVDPPVQHQQEMPSQQEMLSMLYNRIMALEQQVAAADNRATLAEMQAFRAAERATMAQEIAANRVAAPANKVKVRKPDDFDGSRAKVDSFLRQLKGYLAQEPGLNDEAKLNIALGFCVGSVAGTWADRQALLIAGNKDGRILDLEAFEQSIKDTFGDPEKGSTARHKLRMLKQQGTSIEQFTIKFELLEADAGLDEMALIDLWKDAIDRHIWEKCYEALEIPKTLKEWKNRCLIYDRNFRRRAEESKLRSNNFIPRKVLPSNMFSTGNRNFGRNFPVGKNFNTPIGNLGNFNHVSAPAPPAASSSTTHVPMDIDRARRPQGANIQRCPLICYRCGRPGHRRFECPENRIRTIEVVEEEVKEDEKGFLQADEE